MQSFYPEQFVREMSCTEAEWLSCLPRAVGKHACEIGSRSARVMIVPGELTLSWQPLAPLVIALMRLPRLRVSFWFSGVGTDDRLDFMKRFDLYTLRGGG